MAEKKSKDESGPYYRDCTRCGDDVVHGSQRLCADCIRTTAGECDICTEYREEICGYHATCYWYCPDCGYIRMVGNNPARPGTEKTVGCYNHPLFDEESHRMIRLSYTSTAEKRLRDYIKGAD